MAPISPRVEVEKDSKPIFSKDDRVILVLGNTGVGKSTFIQTLTGENTGIGMELQSRTAVVSVYRYKDSKERRVVLVDTPGLDDTKRPDAVVLAAIASWLAAIYTHQVIPEGILYLHRISDPRVSGSTLKRMHIYMRLIGEEAMANTTFITTDWPPATDEKYPVAEDRENQLVTDLNYLRPYIQQGAKYKRFYLNQQSAQEVMDSIPFIPTSQRVPLQIQKELVDQRLGLQTTHAGKLVAASLKEMLEFYNDTIEELKNSIKSLKDARDSKSMKKRVEVEERLELYRDIVADMKRDGKVLEANLWKKLAKSILRVLRLTVKG